MSHQSMLGGSSEAFSGSTIVATLSSPMWQDGPGADFKDDHGAHLLTYDLNGTFVVNAGSKFQYSRPQADVNYTFLVTFKTLGFYQGTDNRSTVSSYESLQTSNIKPYDFDSSAIAVLIATSMCCVVAWSIFVSSLLTRKTRPYLQILTFLYVSVVLSVHFGVALNEFYRHNASAYLSSREWILKKFIGSDALSVVLLSCFTLVLILEAQLLEKMMHRQWQKRLVLWLGAAFVCVDTVLWGLAYTERWGGHKLPYYLEVWSGFELGMQALMFIVVAVWAIGCFQFAFALPTLGIALLSLLGCIAPIVTTSFNFFVDLSYIYLTATLCARCWACLMVFQWSNAVKHRMLKQRIVGKLGAQISRKTAHTYQFAGDGSGSGDTSRITRFGTFMCGLIGPKYQVRGVTVEDQDRRSVESVRNTDDTLPVHTYPLRSNIPLSSETPEYSHSDLSSPPTSPGIGPANLPAAITEPGPSNIPGAASPGLPGISEVNEDNEEELPDFVPHPRFRRGDYWDEKQGRHF